MHRILIVDKSIDQIELTDHLLGLENYEIFWAFNGVEAISMFEKYSPHLVLLDHKVESINVFELLKFIKNFHPSSLVIILTTGTDDITAVKLMKAGADDYLTKPFEIDHFTEVVKKNLAQYCELSAEEDIFSKLMKLDSQPAQVFEELDLSDILGTCRSMEDIIHKIKMVAKLPTRVLIQGETGTGKEIVAKAIHFLSDRKQEVFIPLNCAALPDNLLESELFGYEKGAFTDAKKARDGLFQVAKNGSLFLDEIGETSFFMQAKLLRVLQEGEVRKVGGNASIKVNTRVVAATNRILEEEVKKNKFREDLYFRLNVVLLQIPALRERTEEIPRLASFFLYKYSRIHRKYFNTIEPALNESLCNYHWPGNIRELENNIEKGIIFGRPPVLKLQDMPFLPSVSKIINSGQKAKNHKKLALDTDISIPFFQARDNFEQEYLKKLLLKTNNNLLAASKLAKIGRTTLREKARKYGLLD